MQEGYHEERLILKSKEQEVLEKHYEKMYEGKSTEEILDTDIKNMEMEEAANYRLAQNWLDKIRATLPPCGGKS